MKHKLLFAAATAALMAAPSMAFAQDSGVYIKGQAGYGVVTDAEVAQNNNLGFTMQGDIAGEGNLAVALGLGYDFGNNWRLELEAGTLYNDLGAIGGQPNSYAKVNYNTLMLNALYDFDDFGRWVPYIGAGIGVSEGNFSLAASDFPNDTGTVIVSNPACVGFGIIPAGSSRACTVNNSEKNLAWNLIAGVGYDITDNLSWDTNYKYMDMGTADLEGSIDAVLPGAAPLIGFSETLLTEVQDANAHVLMTGFRYRFGKATPPPPPPPPPPVTYDCWDGTEVTDLDLCPAEIVEYTCWDGVTTVEDLALCPPQLFLCPDNVTSVQDLSTCPPIDLCPEDFRQELIYYEFDRGQSAETRNTINRILDVGQFCRISGVRVVGHTDTSGSATYNQGLSERRASDAREELIRQGVEEYLISSEGKGESEPFVQTGDGVREQLNRRTEVLITLSEVAN